MGNCRKKISLLLVLIVLPATALAVSSTVSVSATVLSKSKCRFNTPSAILSFGNLDPLAAPDVTRQTTLDFVCNGSADPAVYAVSDDDGLHETAADANRMQHATAAANYLPYSFSISPTSGSVPKGVAQTLTVTGTVLGNDYRTAVAGSYTDVVVVTINP